MPQAAQCLPRPVTTTRQQPREARPHLELAGPAVGADGVSKLAQRVRQVGREGPVDVRLQLVEVDLNQLVVLRARVSLQVLPAATAAAAAAAAVGIMHSASTAEHHV
jgi:hypothetical protein